MGRKRSSKKRIPKSKQEDKMKMEESDDDLPELESVTEEIQKELSGQKEKAEQPGGKQKPEQSYEEYSEVKRKVEESDGELSDSTSV